MLPGCGYKGCCVPRKASFGVPSFGWQRPRLLYELAILSPLLAVLVLLQSTCFNRSQWTLWTFLLLWLKWSMWLRELWRLK
jgi:hypothetical protein